MIGKWTRNISAAVFLAFLLPVLLTGCGLPAEHVLLSTAPPLEAVPEQPTPGSSPLASAFPSPTLIPSPVPTRTPTPHPLAIESMRARDYPGSEIVFEEALPPGTGYQRYIVSYRSEGLKIFALMTVPNGEPPESGWPVVVFNHGYIPPAEYRTTERYVAYVDAFARAGYIVFRSDYRGHDRSEGEARGAYGVPDYTVDVLNAVSSLRHFPGADPARIGMWGHSMGGHITLRAMVTTSDIKAGVIWAGVVASYSDLLTRWRATPTPSVTTTPRRWRSELTDLYGSPERNPDFWDSISPISFVSEISGPVQLHHGTNDDDVPLYFSESLAAAFQAAGMPYEFYTYPGDNHNISGSFSEAMGRSVAFFDRYLK